MTRSYQEHELSGISDDQKDFMINLCFRTLESSLKNETLNLESLELSREEKMLNDMRYPVFVSWYDITSGDTPDGKLKGCIGTFYEARLLENIQKYAVLSANDPRFIATPLTADEMDNLNCNIHILHDFRSKTSIEDWDVREQGLVIKFEDPRDVQRIQHLKEQLKLIEIGHIKPYKVQDPSEIKVREYKATYLPGVAASWGYDKVHTLHSLIRKAGYDGPLTKELLSDLYGARTEHLGTNTGLAEGLTVYWTRHISGRDPHLVLAKKAK